MANTDFFVQVGSPGSATSITSPGHSTGGTTLPVASTANFPPVGQSTIFAIDTFTNQTINGQTVQVRDAGSYTEWEAVVTDATTLSNMVIRYGTDQPYLSTTATRVYIPVSSSRENRLVAGILQQHNQQGGHTAVTATTVTTSGAITSGGLVTATNGLNVSGGAVTLPNGSLPYASLLSTIFSGQVMNQANAGSAGGTIYYLNLGGIKFVWGQTGGIATGTTANITFPTGFFTTIQSGQLTAGPVSGTGSVEVTWQTGGLTATTGVVQLNATGGAGTMPVNYFVIGS